LGEVDAFSIPGLKCYFGSNDHYPQHFEVLKRGQWVIRVFFLRSTRKRGLSWDYKSRWKGAVVVVAEAQEILEMVLAHKRRLLSEWNKKVCAAREEKEDLKYEHKKKSGVARRG
jgi:hypothetical protein